MRLKVGAAAREHAEGGLTGSTGILPLEVIVHRQVTVLPAALHSMRRILYQTGISAKPITALGKMMDVFMGFTIIRRFFIEPLQ